MRLPIVPLLFRAAKLSTYRSSYTKQRFQMQALETTAKTFERTDGSHLVKCYVEDYDKLLAEKVSTLHSLLSWDKDIEVFESARSHFRMRANFQMWHDDPKNKVPSGFYYTMNEPGEGRKPCEVVNFPRGTQLINKLMSDFVAVFKEKPVIFANLFEVRFLTTQTQEAIVVLCYKRPLPDNWLEVAEVVAKDLGVKIVGRARKMMQVTGGDETIVEKLTVKGKEMAYYQTEGAFTQPNAGVCEKMIAWSMDRTEGNADKDLLELYCGGGTFTAHMARNFRRVLATEISKTSVELAQKTFALNGITNIQIAKLSSEEFSAAYSGTKTFPHLQKSGIDLQSYDISTVLVDPPRAGLDPGTCQLLSRFPAIVYISCNPETLARDVKALSATHVVDRVAAFDQFPYTHHLEAGVYLVKKEASATATAGAKHGLEQEQANEEQGEESSEKKQRN
jgi:tRNA (uracil-5-)-methyltransferase